MKQELCLSSKSSGYVILNGGRQDHAENLLPQNEMERERRKKYQLKQTFQANQINDEKGFKDVLRAFQSLRVEKRSKVYI